MDARGGASAFWLAAVRDVFSNRTVGWKTSDRCDTELVLGALEYGVWSRGSRADEDRRGSRRFVPAACDTPTATAAFLAGQTLGHLTPEQFRERGGMPTFLINPVTGRYLSFEEREVIALLKAQGAGVREIAGQIGRDPATVSRELRRNAATRGGKLDYRASVAQWKAELMARRPKTAKLVANERLHDYVQQRLSGQVRHADGLPVAGPATAAWKGRNKPHRQDRRWAQAWSPEQISNRLKVDFPDDESMRISHEAIYQALFVQSRGALKRELVACLRTGRALRVPRSRARRRAGGHVTPEVMISERPAEVEDRAVPGHWEGDLIIGTDRSAIGTIVRRAAVETDGALRPRGTHAVLRTRLIPGATGPLPRPARARGRGRGRRPRAATRTRRSPRRRPSRGPLSRSSRRLRWTQRPSRAAGPGVPGGGGVLVPHPLGRRVRPQRLTSKGRRAEDLLGRARRLRRSGPPSSGRAK